MTFLDIGANIGLYSIVSALKVGESGKVYAFEPQPNLANIIHQNVTLNNFNNIIVHNCALADKNGTLELYFPNPENDGEATLGSLTSSSVPNINVDVNTLDELYAKSQSFLKTDYVIKIDVEGAEYSVLQGSRELFEIKKPEIILCECYDKFLKRFGHSDEDLFNLLKNYGYEIFALVGRFSPKFIQCDNYLQYKEQANCSSEILAILPETKSYEKLNKRCIKL
jgi:FkbM family methyltransferase